MQIRSLGLAMAGGVLLGAWIAASPAAAAPKAPIGAASRVNLTLAQQDLASAWYRELGKIKREGLDAARRGDDHAVGSAIGKAGIVVISAKHGEGALRTLPIFIREQIAAAGRRVAKTLSTRRPAAGHASRAGKRRVRQASPHSKSGEDAFFTRVEWDKNGEPISSYISFVHDRDSDARRRNPERVSGIIVNDRDIDLNLQPTRRPKSPPDGRASKPRAKSSGGAMLDDDITTFFGGLPLVSALFSTPPAEIEERQLRNVARYYSEAQAALSQGPNASEHPQVNFEVARDFLLTLADPKATRSPRVRALARSYLSRLPDRYVLGYAFTRDDGTVAADPDPFIQSQLMWRGELLLNFAGGPGGGGAD